MSRLAQIEWGHSEPNRYGSKVTEKIGMSSIDEPNSPSLDLPSSPAGTRGASTRRKYAALDEFLAEEERSFSGRAILRKWLRSVGVLLTLLALVLYIVSLFFITRGVIRVTVEASLLLALFIMNLILNFFQAKTRHLRGVLRIRAKLQQVGRRQPAGADEQTLLRVAKAIVDRERHHRPAPIARLIAYLRKSIIIVAIFAIALSLLAVSIRMGSSSVIRPEWPWMYLLRNIYILLPVLPLVFPMFIKFLYALQNAKILALFQVEQSQRKKTEEEQAQRLMNSPGSPSYGDSDPSGGGDQEAQETVNKKLPVREIPLAILMSYTQKLFFATDYTIPQVSMFDLLGDMTAIISLDKQSLCTKDPHVGRVMVFHSGEQTTLELKRVPGIPAEIEFSAARPIEEYLSAVKPLGLNCMLMSDGIGTGKEFDFSLKSLGRAIGFKESILESFAPVREIEISKSQDGHRMMTSLVVREPRGGLQFFSRGDLELVLSNCLEYWDGAGIKPLDDKMRKSIIDAYKLWHHGQGYACIGMAYKAVTPKYNYLFEPKERKRSASGSAAAPTVGGGENRSRSNSAAIANSRKRSVSKGEIIEDDRNISGEEDMDDDNDNSDNETTTEGSHTKALPPRAKLPTLKGSKGSHTSAKMKRTRSEDSLEQPDEEEVAATGVVTIDDRESAFSTEVDSSWIEEERQSAMASPRPSRSAVSLGSSKDKHAARSPLIEEEIDSDFNSVLRSADGDMTNREWDSESSETGVRRRQIAADKAKRKEKSDETASSDSSAKNKSKKRNKRRISESSSEFEEFEGSERIRTRSNRISSEGYAEDDEREDDAPQAAASSSGEEDETEEDRNKRRLKNIRERQIFIGMVGILHDPKTSMPGFVDALNNSFMRFIYLSQDPEGPTKMFGGRLGLETDWNSIITLKDPDPHAKAKETHSSPKPKIQKLPVGISAIQDHIDNVDNVPLLVRLFCDATPETKAQLIHIMQDNGEMIFSFGQATNPQHYLSQVQSDFSMGVLPYLEASDIPDGQEFHSDEDSFSEQDSSETVIDVDEFLEAKAARSKTLMSHLLQLSSTLISEEHHFVTTSLELIKMGRYLLQNASQSLWFLFGAALTLQIHQTLTAIFLVANSLDAIMLLWLSCVIIPLLASSLLSTPPQPKLMKIISDKNVPIKNKKIIRIGLYFVARALPSVIVALAVFVLHDLWIDGGIPELFGVVDPSDLTAFGQSSFQNALIFSQNIGLFAFVFFMVISSMAFHSRTRSIFKFNPFQNSVWVICAICAIVLQVVFLLIYLHGVLYQFGSIGWYVYVITFCWPIFIIIIDELVKSHERHHWKLNQEILRLEFETKLGMHSPI